MSQGEKAKAKDEEARVIEDLETQYGKTARFRLPSGELIVIRRCSSAERARIVDKLNHPKGSAAAARKELALSVVVHPERERAKQLLEDYPALYDKLSDRAYELAGAEIEEEGKD